jgi:hypothetical protein
VKSKELSELQSLLTQKEKLLESLHSDFKSYKSSIDTLESKERALSQ